MSDPLAINPLISNTRSFERIDLNQEMEHVTKAETEEEIRQVAKDFESFFVSYLFKVMRDSVPESGLFGNGFGNDVTQSMLDDAHSRNISEAGGIGLAEVLEVQLRRNAGLTDFDE